MEDLRRAEVLLSLGEFGIAAVAHLGIVANRVFRRGIDPDSWYQIISLYTEHWLSHATRPLFYTSFGRVVGIPPESLPYLGLMGAVSTGFIRDGIDCGRPQWDQLFFNLLGWGTYGAISLSG